MQVINYTMWMLINDRSRDNEAYSHTVIFNSNKEINGIPSAVFHSHLYAVIHIVVEDGD